MRCDICGHGTRTRAPSSGIYVHDYGPWWYCAIRDCGVSEGYVESFCPLLRRMRGVNYKVVSTLDDVPFTVLDSDNHAPVYVLVTKSKQES